MRALIILPATLTLAACIEMDMVVEVLGEDEARITGFIEMERPAFEMSGGNPEFCPEEDGGTLELTDTYARCSIDKTGTFAEIMPTESSGDTPAELRAALTYLGEDRVRALLPLSAMGVGIEEFQDDPTMRAMMQQMLAGLSVTFTIRGREIERSTGTISEDGRAASITLGVDDLLAPEPERLDDFETILRF